MGKRYMQNLPKAIAAFFAAFLLLGMALTALMLPLYVAAGVCTVLGTIFLVIGCLNISFVQITDGKVINSLFVIPLKSMKLSDIKEIGVAGTKVIGNPKKTGTCYIYFSPVKMSDKERFQMCLAWPPKNKIYMAYDSKRYQAVQSVWSSEIEEYNCGDLEL